MLELLQLDGKSGNGRNCTRGWEQPSPLFCLCTSSEHGAAPDAKYFLGNRGVGMALEWWHTEIPSTGADWNWDLTSGILPPSPAGRRVPRLTWELNIPGLLGGDGHKFWVLFLGFPLAQPPPFLFSNGEANYPALVLIQREEFPALLISPRPVPSLSPPSWEKQEFQQPGGADKLFFN